MRWNQDWRQGCPGMANGCWPPGPGGCCGGMYGGGCFGGYPGCPGGLRCGESWNRGETRAWSDPPEQVEEGGSTADAYAGYLEGLTPYGIKNRQSLQNREMMRTITGGRQEARPDAGYASYYEEDREEERDRERLKSLYPETAREVMPYVEEECDRMEYEGSMMFDEYPDKGMLSRISARIFEQVREKYEVVEGKDEDEAMAMNVETRRRYPPGKNWLRDLIDVMLYEEVYRRRCRRRRCRRQW